MDFLKAAIASSKQKLGTNGAGTTSSGSVAGVKRKADELATAAASSSPAASTSAAVPAATASTIVQPPAAKKFKTRGEIEAERQAQLQREKEERMRKRQNGDYASSSSLAASSSSVPATSPSPSPPSVAPSAPSDSESKSADDSASLLSANEVKRRLRNYGEAITLFGESDNDRFQRLKLFELHQHERLSSSVGRKNILKDILEKDVEAEIQKAIMEDMERKKREGEADADGHEHAAPDNRSAEELAAAADVAADLAAAMAADDDGGEGNDDGDGKGAKASSSASSSQQPKKIDYRGKDLRRADFQRSEDFVLYFFKRMLSEWESELDARPKEVRMSDRGKMASATQKQTRQFMRPLFKLLKTRTTTPDILKACEKICTSCLDRNYTGAEEAYLTMAIGNAAWPMGVTMVGIHERAGREKIFDDRIAHVLNDETQRKYIQSIKRLMTFCADHYPPHEVPRGKGS